jgi:hypothetical protein
MPKPPTARKSVGTSLRSPDSYDRRPSKPTGKKGGPLAPVVYDYSVRSKPTGFVGQKNVPAAKPAPYRGVVSRRDVFPSPKQSKANNDALKRALGKR